LHKNSEMEIKGKIIEILPEQSGTSKNGQWKKQEYILETEGQYAKKVCFNLWGEKIDQNPVKPGDLVTVHFDLESREFNGRWYTDVRGWKIEAQSASQSEMPPPPGIDDMAPPVNDAPPLEEDDLPF
jgi:hypothetical protein